MGVQLIGAGGVVAEVGEFARKPQHVSTLARAGNWYRLSAVSGTIGAALAANSPLFQFRFLSGTKTYALLYKAKISMGIVAVGTAIGPVGFELVPVRGWVTIGAGGTRIANTGDNMQTETGLPNSQVSDIGIATTAALTSNATLDANGIGNVLTGTLTGATTVQQTAQLLSGEDLFNAADAGDQPFVMANQEGFVIKTTHAGPTALTYVVGVTIAWCEVTAY